MKLLFSPNSPFARKVRVFVRERGAQPLVSEIVMQPFDGPPALLSANPLGKVPVLQLEGGTSLMDSPLIVEFLDVNLPGEPTLPIGGVRRWATLRRQAIADGLMDAAVAIVFERQRHDAAPSEHWVNRWTQAIERSVLALEAEATQLAPSPDIGSIAVACALGYLDFRHGDLEWRSNAPQLSQWFRQQANRSSMLDTAPG